MVEILTIGAIQVRFLSDPASMNMAESDYVRVFVCFYRVAAGSEERADHYCAAF